MPLPSMKTAKRCTAKAKSTGKQCNNPVKGSIGRVCRLHGWRSADTIKIGQFHWNYQHGQATKEARAHEKTEKNELRQIETMLEKLKLI